MEEKKKQWMAQLSPLEKVKKKLQSIWLAVQSPQVKGERKGRFCAFRTSGAQKDTHTQPHNHELTRARTHRYLLDGGSDLSLCSANQTTVLSLRRASQRRGAIVETPAGSTGGSFKLYKD
ncbi:hypothetical protein FQA47_023549 [Oryzias melastigma]|uniref:Uncharacterized protein n=1 Tax=Oryzias melastigma TaxID=30732 RepID=A0A834FPL7_ORYME|nr:hypothetical protein FQA47_023549 [Oryzias melastigma]